MILGNLVAPQAASGDRRVKAVAPGLAVVLCLTANAGAPAAAAGWSPPDVVADARSSPESGPTEAGAVGVAEAGGVLSDAALNEIARTAHHLRRAALELMGEVERVEGTIINEPDMPGGALLPPVSTPDGSTRLGALMPPDQKSVDGLMKRIGTGVAGLQTQMEATALPDFEKETLGPTWNDMRKHAHDAATAYRNLQYLTEGKQGEEMDNMAIGRQALRIYDSMHEIEQLRARAHKLIQRQHLRQS